MADRLQPSAVSAVFVFVLGLASGTQQFLLGAMARQSSPTRAAAVNAAAALVALAPFLLVHAIRRRDAPVLDLGSVALVLVAGLAYLLIFPAGITWYFLVPGLLGLFLVSGLAFMVPRVGTAAALTGVVAGQVIVSMFWDQLGLLGLTRYPIGPLRLVGALLLIAGVVLVLRRRAV